MEGTIYNDKDGQAQAMEALAYALATGKPLQNLDLPGEIRLEDNKYIRLPYKKVDQKMAEEILSK
jgi:methyl-galactoside transport system substrate-binding protein